MGKNAYSIRAHRLVNCANYNDLKLEYDAVFKVTEGNEVITL